MNRRTQFPVFSQPFFEALISPMQVATLYALFKTNNGSVKQVALFMSRAPSTARYHLQCLASKGLVHLRSDSKRPFRVSPAFLARYMGRRGR